LWEKKDEVKRLDEQNRRRMANLRTNVRQMNDEISQNVGEKVQRWLHDNYNGSDDIHLTKSFEIVQTSKNSMVKVRSQRPESAGMPKNFVSIGDKTYLNNVSKLLARQVLGRDLPKFSSDAKVWPTLITKYRKTTKDCDVSESENMERLRMCLLDTARNCVRMILLTNKAEKAIAMLEKNYGGLDKIIEQLMEEVRLQKQAKDSSDFQEFSNLMKNLAVTVENVGNKSHFTSSIVIKELLEKLPEYPYLPRDVLEKVTTSPAESFDRPR
jgi:hypothetical protein